jgi:hypothetical protein
VQHIDKHNNIDFNIYSLGERITPSKTITHIYLFFDAVLDAIAVRTLLKKKKQIYNYTKTLADRFIKIGKQEPMNEYLSNVNHRAKSVIDPVKTNTILLRTCTTHEPPSLHANIDDAASDAGSVRIRKTLSALRTGEISAARFTAVSGVPGAELSSTLYKIGSVKGAKYKESDTLDLIKSVPVVGDAGVADSEFHVDGE